MPRIHSASELETLKQEILSQKDPDKAFVSICSGTGCLGLGNDTVISAFKNEIEKKSLADRIDLKITGCHGFCEQGPNVAVYPEGIYYVQVKPEDVPEIISQTVLGKKVIDRLSYRDPATGNRHALLSEIPFYKKQQRNLLAANTHLDPTSIYDYIGSGGYGALSKALFQMAPEDVLNEVKTANLRGRGGGGFPAALKWQTARNAKDKEKFVIVNGHEGEPAAYMDRAIFTGNPHIVLEGLIIGAYAIGAKKGFIYTRHDSPYLKENIYTALDQARELGLLGANIMGSGFDFEVEVHFDVGIFVSGESSALMRSIEGRNPEPRPKYIRTSVQGVWDKPTNLNNVETWANVPQIILNGADWYCAIGTEKSKGTKMVSLSGNVVNAGVVEVPFGTTLREIIFDIGGGIPNGKKLKALHFGGAMGGAIPESLVDTPLDFDALQKVGAPMGAGALMVMDEDTDMVEAIKFFLEFLTKESCGKCVPCREGIRQMIKILSRICDGNGRKDDLDTMQEIAEVMSDASLCSLGKTACDPLKSAMRYFKDEFEAKLA